MQLEFYVSLRIFGMGLDFDNISQGLGFQPSATHRRGDRGLVGPYSQDMWQVQSPLARKEPMDAHLNWLRRRLSSHYNFLRKLAERVELSSYCGVGVDDNHCSFQISPEPLKMFRELGIPLNLSVVMTGLPERFANAAPESTSDGSAVDSVDTGEYQEDSGAALEVTGSGLDLTSISANLRFAPSEPSIPCHFDSTGGDVEAPRWSFGSGLSSGEALDTHLKRLGDLLLPHLDFLRSLSTDAKLLFLCSVATENDRGGVKVSPEALRIPVQLDAPIEFKFCLI